MKQKGELRIQIWDNENDIKSINDGIIQIKLS